MTQNKAAILYGAKDVRVEDVLTEAVGNDEILLEMRSVGVCGTDLHFYLAGEIHGFSLPVPSVPGHEGSGKIVGVGKNVDGFTKGDIVVLDPNPKCRMCDFCVTGRDNLCITKGVYRGFFERFHVHKADRAYKLPSNFPDDEAALIEPVACGVHTARRAKIAAGHSVLICGAGPIGLLSMLVAKVYGAETIIVTDIDEKRLSLAKELGASETILVKKGIEPTSLGEEVYAINGGSGVDVTLECSGVPFSFQVAAYATKEGGRVVVAGLYGKDMTNIPVNIFTCKEIDIAAMYGFTTADFREAIQLVINRRAPFASLITHRFPLTSVNDAFKTLISRDERVVKIVIECQK